MDAVLGKILRDHGDVNRRDDDMPTPSAPPVDRRAQMSDFMVREPLTSRLHAAAPHWPQVTVGG